MDTMDTMDTMGEPDYALLEAQIRRHAPLTDDGEMDCVLLEEGAPGWLYVKFCSDNGKYDDQNGAALGAACRRAGLLVRQDRPRSLLVMCGPLQLLAALEATPTLSVSP